MMFFILHASAAQATCVDSREWPFEIIQKIDDHTYEVVGEMEESGIHKMLKTKKAIFNNSGKPLGFMVEDSAEVVSAKLKNGFTKKYGVSKECGLILLPPPENTNYSLVGAAIRERVKGVDAESEAKVKQLQKKCEDKCYQKITETSTRKEVDTCYDKCK